MRKLFFLCISFLLLSQVYEISASQTFQDEGRPSWLFSANDPKPVESDNFWFYFNFWNSSNKENTCNVSLALDADVEKNELQNNLQTVDCSAVERLLNRIRHYVKHDETLEALNIQLQSYTEEIQKFNKLSGMDNNKIVLLPTTIDQINRHVDIMIANKNVDFTWQMKEYGPIQGTLFCIKNLCMPRNMHSYIGAGASTLYALITLQKKQNITINAQAGAQFIIGNNQSASQDILKTAAVCSFVAGTTVAAMQLYTSLMYRDQSKEKLAGWIQNLQTHNNGLTSQFLLKDMQNNTKNIESKVDNLSDRMNSNHQDNQVKFFNIEHRIVGVSMQLGTLQTQQCIQHTENQEQCHQIRHQTEEILKRVKVITQEQAQWLVQDAKDKSDNKKIMNSVCDRFTSLNDRYTVDSLKFGKKLDAIASDQSNQTGLLQEVLHNQSDQSRQKTLPAPTSTRQIKNYEDV